MEHHTCLCQARSRLADARQGCATLSGQTGPSLRAGGGGREEQLGTPRQLQQGRGFPHTPGPEEEPAACPSPEQTEPRPRGCSCPRWGRWLTLPAEPPCALRSFEVTAPVNLSFPSRCHGHQLSRACAACKLFVGPPCLPNPRPCCFSLSPLLPALRGDRAAPLQPLASLSPARGRADRRGRAGREGPVGGTDLRHPAGSSLAVPGEGTRLLSLLAAETLALSSPEPLPWGNRLPATHGGCGRI